MAPKGKQNGDACALLKPAQRVPTVGQDYVDIMYGMNATSPVPPEGGNEQYGTYLFVGQQCRAYCYVDSHFTRWNGNGIHCRYYNTSCFTCVLSDF